MQGEFLTQGWGVVRLKPWHLAASSPWAPMLKPRARARLRLRG